MEAISLAGFAPDGGHPPPEITPGPEWDCPAGVQLRTPCPCDGAGSLNFALRQNLPGWDTDRSWWRTL